MTDPGLDLTHLRALRGHARRTLTADARRVLLERIADHLEEFDGYLAFSGGKDSVVLLDLVRRVDPAIPVVFFDSGLEYPETYDYIGQLADAWNLNLHVHSCQPDLLTLLYRAGTWDMTIPTATQRQRLREVLIEAPSAAAHTEYGQGVLWGVRADESSMRRNFYGRILTREIAVACDGCCPDRETQIDRHGGISRRADGTVAYGPIWRWPTSQIWEHCSAQQIPLNPVYAKLRAMGAPAAALRVTPMVDAAVLAAGRVTWLRRGWPDLTEQLMTVLPRLREFV